MYDVGVRLYITEKAFENFQNDFLKTVRPSKHIKGATIDP